MSQLKIDLNLFTNCTKNHSGDASLIANTYYSFVTTFGLCNIENLRVFIDPEPSRENLSTYIDSILAAIKFPRSIDVITTNGLADGYIKSVNMGDSEYIFQLEHDWEFLPTIRHDLSFLTQCMSAASMDHLRLNKRTNINKTNERLQELSVYGWPFCETQQRSNNPHIIKRSVYKEKYCDYMDLSNTPKRADGVENKLIGQKGYIYGGKMYPQAIRHTDGRS